jgi:hypothetical protein
VKPDHGIVGDLDMTVEFAIPVMHDAELTRKHRQKLDIVIWQGIPPIFTVSRDGWSLPCICFFLFLNKVQLGLSSCFAF